MKQLAQKTSPAMAVATPVGLSSSHDTALAERQQAIAQYISDMILELRNMAKSANLVKVLVPLEFAYYEAFSEANRVVVPEAERQRLERLSRMAAEMQAKESPIS